MYPHVGNWESAGLAKTAYEALTPFSLIQHFGGGGELPRQAGFLKFSDDRLLLNALKRPEKGPGFILRLTNPTPKTIAFTMECLRPLCRVALCDMAEKALKALKVSRNQVRLTAGPKKIMTIFFDLVPESDA
jgi:alpha-mannosidase